MPDRHQGAAFRGWQLFWHVEESDNLSWRSENGPEDDADCRCSSSRNRSNKRVNERNLKLQMQLAKAGDTLFSDLNMEVAEFTTGSG